MTEGTPVSPAGEYFPDPTPPPPRTTEAPQAGFAEFRTEFPFMLPRGYMDAQGVVHRSGMMRLATARDELLPLGDMRVRENPAYLSVVLIGRLITRLGSITEVDARIVEQMFAVDLAFLQRFYEKINTDGSSLASTVCPDCRHEFEIDMGSRLGE